MSLEAKLEAITEKERDSLVSSAEQSFDEYRNELALSQINIPLASFAYVTRVKKVNGSIRVELTIKKFPEKVERWEWKERIKAFEASSRAANIQVTGRQVTYSLFDPNSSSPLVENIPCSAPVAEYFSNLRRGERLVVGIRHPFIGSDEKGLAYILRPDREDLVRIAEKPIVVERPKIMVGSQAVELLQREGYVVPDMVLGARISDGEIQSLSLGRYLHELSHPRIWCSNHPEYASGYGTTKGKMLKFITSRPRDTIRTQLVLHKLAKI